MTGPGDDDACTWARQRLHAHALGALDEDEQRRLEAHLEGCGECRQMAAELTETANALPAALATASPLRPPPRLKDRLIAEVDRSARPRRRSWWRPRAAIALAGVAVTALLVTWNVRLENALSQQRTLRARIAHLTGQQERILEVVDSRHTEKTFLAPPEGSASEAYGKLFTRSDLADVVVLGARLAPPGPDTAYHVWLTDRRGTELAGVLAVDRSGFGVLLFRAERAGPDYEAARIILQPKGSKRPSGRPALESRAEREAGS
jgi:Anti-sigma-K factor rskA/Putative zinc-finger